MQVLGARERFLGETKTVWLSFLDSRSGCGRTVFERTSYLATPYLLTVNSYLILLQGRGDER